MCTSASALASGVSWDSSECRKDNDDEQLDGQDVVHVRDSIGDNSRQRGTRGCAGQKFRHAAVRNRAKHRKLVQWSSQ